MGAAVEPLFLVDFTPLFACVCYLMYLLLCANLVQIEEK